MPSFGQNIDKDPIRVRHDELSRVDYSDSPFRSWCPVCDKGILLVGRNQKTFQLSRVDRCTGCGQIVIYTDDDIHGVSLLPPLDELDGVGEGHTHGCKLCGAPLHVAVWSDELTAGRVAEVYESGGLVPNEDPTLVTPFCGPVCKARWEAGERPKWRTRWERLLDDDE